MLLSQGAEEFPRPLTPSEIRVDRLKKDELPKVIVITGPTATGKTRLGILLAKKYGGEIISADSMQVYKGMDIGTATPDTQEMDGVPHHLINTVEPTESYSAARFVKEASEIVDNIIKRENSFYSRWYRPVY